MSGIPHQHRRKTVLINPRLQMGIAVTFGLVVLFGGAVFAGVVYVQARAALWDASMRGHYFFQAPVEIVHDILVRNILLLGGLAILACGIVLFLFVRRIHAGMTRVIETLRASAEGDLSTPTNAPGVREITFFGNQLDAVRGHILSSLAEIRAEVEFLRTTPLPDGEAGKRWQALKEKMGRIAL